MALTLAEQIAADAAAGGVFFSADGNGPDEAVTHWIAGDPSNHETIRCVVEDGEDINTVTASAQLRPIDGSLGAIERGLVRLEMSIDVDVTEPIHNDDAVSIFVLADGRKLKCVRIAGRDAALQLVECQELRKKSQRKPGAW
jgi:hypothetical protein